MSVNDEIIWKIKQIDSNILYLGKAEAARDLNLINSYQIKTVLSITHTMLHLSYPSNIKHYQFILKDQDYFGIKNNISMFNQTMKERIKQGNVLVHCISAVSKAPSFIIAFFINYYNWDYAYAYDYLKRIRTLIHPTFEQKKYLNRYAAESTNPSDQKKRAQSHNVTHCQSQADIKEEPIQTYQNGNRKHHHRQQTDIMNVSKKYETPVKQPQDALRQFKLPLNKLNQNNFSVQQLNLKQSLFQESNLNESQYNQEFSFRCTNDENNQSKISCQESEDDSNLPTFAYLQQQNKKSTHRRPEVKLKQRNFYQDLQKTNDQKYLSNKISQSFASNDRKLKKNEKISKVSETFQEDIINRQDELMNVNSQKKEQKSFSEMKHKPNAATLYRSFYRL